MSDTTAPSAENDVTLTDAERESIQDSSGAPGRLSRRHFEAVQRIKADAYAAGLAAGRARVLPPAVMDDGSTIEEDGLDPDNLTGMDLGE